MTLSALLDACDRLNRPARLLAFFCAGSAAVLAMPPYGAWPLLFAGMSLFYVMLSKAKNRLDAFLSGWGFGFGYFVFGLSWIANALTVEGSTYSWVIPFAIAGLPALLAFFPAFSALACARPGHLRSFRGFCLFTGSMTLGEWLRGHVFTGFPWNLYGYGWDGVQAVAQGASLAGAYGLTLATVAWAAAPGFCLVWNADTRRRTAVIALAALSLTSVFAWGTLRLRDNPTVADPRFILRTVQPSIPQSLKWDDTKEAESFRRIVEASAADGFTAPDGATILMIWPETAVDQGMMQNPAAIETLRRTLESYPQNRLFLASGLLRWERDKGRTKYFNSIGLFDRDLNLIATYDKAHLVPFGEYIPFSRWLPANPLVRMEGFESGPGAGLLALPLNERDAVKISPMICYEAIFPGESVKRGSRPSLILNVTNDGWYGDSAGPRQHLSIARFRAIEEGAPLARAANSGISAVIDSYGRILWRKNIFEIGAGEQALPATAARPTLYSRYGDWPAIAGFLILCGIGLLPCSTFNRRTHT